MRAEPIRVVSYGSTSIGRSRPKNEDAFLREDRLRLYAVADGVGGQPAGEIASQVAIKSLHDFFHKNLPSTKPPADLMLTALEAASDAVLTRSDEDDECRGMATTLTVCWITDHFSVVIGHVGDSQGMLVRGGRLRQITEEHTVAGELRGRGVGNKHPALNTVFAHMLTQSVGPEPLVKPQISELPLKHNDILLLCSDGVTRQIYLAELSRAVRHNTPERAVEEMLQLADERGGLDNATAVVVKVL